MPTLDPCAYFPGVSARELAQVSHDPADLDRGGRWAVAIGFEGETVLARFREWDEHSPPGAQWRGVTGPWHTSLSRTQYQQGVRAVQAHIGRGWVYQVNLCRVLSAPCDADAGRAELGVAIRTFWLRDGRLHFGTGAGITWGSDPAGEWQETVLKAQRLIGIADSVAG